jgi:cellulose synthase/poly-beta-1,6-N-acetylglucosamine synthase-like glycosyltransferase
MKHRLRSDASLINVLIPAHNEADGIEQTLASLLNQDQRPDQIVVIADNCTDDTVAIVRRFAESATVTVRVYETVDNVHKKAGALNQYLIQLLPTLRDDDYLLVMDADSELDSRWISRAAAESDSGDTIGAVGGVFYGRLGGGVLAQFQRNEYQRYARDIGRKKARAMVLTGTATMYPARVARHVQVVRGSEIPGTMGQVYDTLALTEDNEFTLALKTLGYRCVSPQECRVTTELMPTWRDLWLQRMRWQRGALENLRHYGFSRVTAPYFLQQTGLAVGILAMILYLLTFTVSLLLHNPLELNPFWTAVGGLFIAERVVTVYRGGWRGILLAFPLAIEMVYDFFQMAIYVVSIVSIAFKREAHWHHVAVSQ